MSRDAYWQIHSLGGWAFWQHGMDGAMRLNPYAPGSVAREAFEDGIVTAHNCEQARRAAARHAVMHAVQSRWAERYL